VPAAHRECGFRANGARHQLTPALRTTAVSAVASATRKAPDFSFSLDRERPVLERGLSGAAR